MEAMGRAAARILAEARSHLNPGGALLCELPLSAPAWIDDPSFRCSTLRRFPYRIFYFLDEDQLVVAAIATGRRAGREPAHPALATTSSSASP